MVLQKVLTVTDFNNILNGYAGREITHIPITKTTTNISDQETLTDGTPVTIKAYFMRTKQNWDYVEAGFFEKGDAVVLSKFADGVVKDDKIYADGLGFTISAIDGDATTITIDTSAVHGLSQGDKVIITNTTNYDGIYTVASITDTDTFTITDNAHNEAAETSGNVTRNYNKYRVKEAFDVPGVYDPTGPGTEFVYTACNLFLEDDAS